MSCIAFQAPVGPSGPLAILAPRGAPGARISHARMRVRKRNRDTGGAGGIELGLVIANDALSQPSYSPVPVPDAGVTPRARFLAKRSRAWKHKYPLFFAPGLVRSGGLDRLDHRGRDRFLGRGDHRNHARRYRGSRTSPASVGWAVSAGLVAIVGPFAPCHDAGQAAPRRTATRLASTQQNRRGTARRR